MERRGRKPKADGEKPKNEDGNTGRRNKRSTERASIPPAVVPPEARPLRLGNEAKIYFDLETTGFGHDSHIVQLAAIGPTGEFLSYVTPTRAIGRRASEVTGIRYEDDVMTHHGRVVESQPLKKALKEFLDFVGEESSGKVAVLVGHNARTFDSRVLVTAAASAGMSEELRESVVGFLDTLRLFRELYPRRRSHKLGDLYKTLVGGSFGAHDALEDTRALGKLLEKADPPRDTLETHTFTVAYVEAALEHLAMKKENVATLAPLGDAGLSDSMLAKMAASGLRMEHLQEVFSRDGADGIRELFTEPRPDDGKARVTKSKAIIAKAIAYFEGRRP